MKAGRLAMMHWLDSGRSIAQWLQLLRESLQAIPTTQIKHLVIATG
jgi:hypothetical protein